jgi:hypothetical protein
MTEQNGTTMRPDLEAEREQRAAEAFERIRTGQHWRDWTYVAEGFDVGRNRAMREAHTNQPLGRGYNEAFSRWMATRPWARSIDKATRNHLFWVADHLTLIEAWRETLPANQRDAWNHPTTVKRAYERTMRVAAGKADARKHLSPQAELKQALIEAQTEIDKWRRRAEQGGSMFDLLKDTPEDIARVIVANVSPSRAETLLQAIRVEIKRQKSAHAG